MKHFAWNRFDNRMVGKDKYVLSIYPNLEFVVYDKDDKWYVGLIIYPKATDYKDHPRKVMFAEGLESMEEAMSMCETWIVYFHDAFKNGFPKERSILF